MPFHYEQNTLVCDGVALPDIAEAAGTPLYVYSAADVRRNYRAYAKALAPVPHTICYSVKANSNGALLRLLAQEGAGFDIVSGGELFRVLRAGGDAKKVVFSGVGKTPAEIEQALAAGIRTFNCESEGEITLINSLAGRRGVRARIAIRVNPDVSAETHPYISTGLREHKFGVDIENAEQVYALAAELPNLQVAGVSCHIGSQILEAGPLLEAVDRLLALVAKLRARGVEVEELDLGGGVGVAYTPDEKTPDVSPLFAPVCEHLRGSGLHLIVEPGRSIVAEAGALLARVLYRKQTGAKEFVIVDAAMTDLIRPALYEAWHDIVPVRRRNAPLVKADVVGPVCESGDFLALDREMPDVMPGDLLAVMTAGAYGFVQASVYNSRPRPAEVLVDKGTWRVVRERETYEDLVRGE